MRANPRTHPVERPSSPVARRERGGGVRTPVRVVAMLAVGVVAGLVVLVAATSVFRSAASDMTDRAAPSVPVEVAPIARGDMRDIRSLSGTLQARSRSLIATRIAGRVEEMRVNIGDVVHSNDVIAILDDAELRQAAEEAAAELQVAHATLAESESNLAIAERNFRRSERLFHENIASEAELDSARAEYEAKEARVRVSESQVARAEAQRRAAQVRLSYATINAVWPNPNGHRIIGERFVDQGSTVAANGPVVSLLDINALIAVIHVAERDYARLRIGQSVSVASDSYRGETFEGQIVRLAPEFREASRQARVEVELANPEHRLKPGMFIRAEVELARADDAIVIPREALIRRRGSQGVFVVDESDMTVRFVPLQVGIAQGNFIQVIDPPSNLAGPVVTLGQHLIDDGSTVRVSHDPGEPPRETLAP